MSNYTLNGISMNTNGYLPGKHAGSDIALRGAWDMPARIGKTFHDWGTQKSVEPYVSADEIRFGGRDIDWAGYVRAGSRNDAIRKVFDLYGNMDAYTTTVPLVSDRFGTFNIYVRGNIEAAQVSGGWFSIRIPFREPVVDLTGDIPEPETGSETGIDGIGFKDLGFTVLSVAGRYNRPGPKSLQAIAYEHEPFRVAPTGLRESVLTGFIMQPDYESFQTAITGLYALFSKPGLRYILLPDDALRDFFVKDGFRVYDITTRGSKVAAKIDIRISEVAAHMDWGILSDSQGNPIVTEFGNILLT